MELPVSFNVETNNKTSRKQTKNDSPLASGHWTRLAQLKLLLWTRQDIDNSRVHYWCSSSFSRLFANYSFAKCDSAPLAAAVFCLCFIWSYSVYFYFVCFLLLFKHCWQRWSISNKAKTTADTEMRKRKSAITVLRCIKCSCCCFFFSSGLELHQSEMDSENTLLGIRVWL